MMSISDVCAPEISISENEWNRRFDVANPDKSFGISLSIQNFASVNEPDWLVDDWRMLYFLTTFWMI